MKNCELAVGIIVGLIIGETCKNIKPKQPIKPVLPCECWEKDCPHRKPSQKPDCEKCYYQRYKRC